MINEKLGNIAFVGLSTVIVCTIGVGGFIALGKKADPIIQEQPLIHSMSSTRVPSSFAQDVTTHWPIYRSEKHYIQFQYPPDWYVVEGGAGISIFERPVGPGLPSISRSIRIEGLHTSANVEAYAKKDIPDSPSRIFLKKERKYVSVAQTQAYQVYEKFIDQMGPIHCDEPCNISEYKDVEHLIMRIYIPHGPEIFSVNVNMQGESGTDRGKKKIDPQDEATYLGRYNQIVGTIQFFEATSSIPHQSKTQSLPPERRKVFSPGNSSLYYVTKQGWKSDVYLQKGQTTIKLISDIEYLGGEGEILEFNTTTEPNVYALVSLYGDMGCGGSNRNFIDAAHGTYVTVATSSCTDSIIVKSSDDERWEIQLASDRCTTGIKNNNTCRNGTSVIEDLTINGNNANILKIPKTLSCRTNLTFGCREEGVYLEFTGLTSDFSTVFFTFSGTHWGYEGEKDQTLWSENYAFDLKNKTIRQEDPHDVIHVLGKSSE